MHGTGCGLTLSQAFEKLTTGSADSASLVPMDQHPSDVEMEDFLECCSYSRELLDWMTLEAWELL